MNRSTGRPVLLVLLVLVAGHVVAADADGRFAVKGAGIDTCSSFLAERSKRSPTYYLFAGWLHGYLSAANEKDDQTFDLAPWQDTRLLLAMVERFCDEQPEERYQVAVRRLLAALAPHRLREGSGMVAVQAGDREGLFYVHTLRALQQRLADAGFYEGAVDGRFEAPVRQALQAFQRDRSLQVTGFPDQTTLFTLFGE